MVTRYFLVAAIHDFESTACTSTGLGGTTTFLVLLNQDTLGRSASSANNVRSYEPAAGSVPVQRSRIWTCFDPVTQTSLAGVISHDPLGMPLTWRASRRG